MPPGRTSTGRDAAFWVTVTFRDEGDVQSADAIIEELNRILVKQFEVDPEQITSEARLRDDLDLDSLDAADLLIAIEKRFRVRLDDTEVRKLTTVGEMHAYVHTVVAQAAAGKVKVPEEAEQSPNAG